MADVQSSADIDATAKKLRDNDPPPLPPDPNVGLGLTNGKVTSDLAGIQRHQIAADESALGMVSKATAEIPKLEEMAKHAGVEADKLKPWNEEAESAKRESDPISNFASLGSVFGILASAFTHAPMQNAMEASAAAITAIKEGNKEDYNRAYKAWQDNTKQALERHKIEHDAFQDALTLMKTNMEAGMTQMRLNAIRFGDQKALVMIEAGMDKDLLEAQAARERLHEQISKNMIPMAEANAEMAVLLNNGYNSKDPNDPKNIVAIKELNKYKADMEALKKDPTLSSEQGQIIREFRSTPKADGTLPTAEEALNFTRKFHTGANAELDRRTEFYETDPNSPTFGDHIASWNKASSEITTAKTQVEATLTDETAKLMADQYLAGDKSVLQNIGRGRQGAANIVKVREMIAAEMKKKNISGVDAAIRMAEFSGATAAQRTLGQRTANVEMFANETYNMIEVAQEKSHALKRTDFRPVNAALQAYEKNTGDPGIRAFGAAINSLINAYAKVIAGGQQSTISDKDHAREIVTAADTQEQFDAVMDVIKQEVQAVRRAPGQVKQELRDLAGSSPALDAKGVSSAPGGIIEYDKNGNRVR